MMIQVFVYGTLRNGESNHRLLERATCITHECWTMGELYDTGYGYPAMKQSSLNKIYGELYSVTETVLKKIDQLEGYKVGRINNLYERIQQTVYTDKGEFVAFLYVANKDHLFKKIIHNGDWKKHRTLSSQMDSFQ